MQRLLFLPVLLLGTVSALHLENDVPSLESLETGADLGQDLASSREQERDLALTEEVTQAEGKEVKASACQDTFEDEEAMESDPAALDKDFQCPREEDIVEVQGSPRCKACHYLLVRTPTTFANAQNVCSKCYRGNLVSIHNFNFNYRIQRHASTTNQAQVWIGGILRGWEVIGDELNATSNCPSSAPSKSAALRSCQQPPPAPQPLLLINPDFSQHFLTLVSLLLTLGDYPSSGKSWKHSLFRESDRWAWRLHWEAERDLGWRGPEGLLGRGVGMGGLGQGNKVK
uniref:Proteoglycan 3, pro eosinophil major basic protein 2 n=1 Tax=Papio anubis TaxID=9555 RepID=A0A8I5N2X9_PAPAN